METILEQFDQIEEDWKKKEKEVESLHVLVKELEQEKNHYVNLVDSLTNENKRLLSLVESQKQLALVDLGLSDKLQLKDKEIFELKQKNILQQKEIHEQNSIISTLRTQITKDIKKQCENYQRLKRE